MGKLDYHPVIHHFSHPHPLELSNYQYQIQSPVSCSGCKIKASGLMYICKTCNYFLHITCSTMPQHITHPVDPFHTLSLIPYPAYPEGFFNCDACGRKGNGFSYHCQACNIDLHIICASMPLSLNHQAHQHPLNLTFSPPYFNKTFCCDICKDLGSKNWLYRCNFCEFDAHLACATIEPKIPLQTPVQPPQGIRYQMLPRTGPQYGTPVTQYARGTQQNYIPNNYVNNPSLGIPLANASIRQSLKGSNLINQAIQGFLTGAFPQSGQNLIQSIMGGGGGGVTAGSGDGGAVECSGGAGDGCFGADPSLFSDFFGQMDLGSGDW